MHSSNFMLVSTSTNTAQLQVSSRLDCALIHPKGPRTQTIRVLGPKYYTVNRIWALKPYYLGPWTLRVIED